MSVLSDLMGPAGQGGRYYGVAFAIVTNNQDPEGMARVKVALPWLGDQVESDWARVVTPMAGSERGGDFLPGGDGGVAPGPAPGGVVFPRGGGDRWVLGAPRPRPPGRPVRPRGAVERQG